MSSYLPALEIARTVITSVLLAREAGAGVLNADESNVLCAEIVVLLDRIGYCGGNVHPLRIGSFITGEFTYQ